MGDVIYPVMKTRVPIPVDRVIEGALEANLESVVIIGTDQDGYLYLSSSGGKCAEIVWMIELAKKLVMEQSDG